MKIKTIHFFFSIILFMFGCQGTEKKNLQEVEKQELAKGTRCDSIFQGLYFGMSEPDFYAHCWKKNKEKIFAQALNMKVDYDLTHNESKFPLKINFFPMFAQEKIYEVPTHITFLNTDYFNPEMKTDKLLIEVKKLMEKWYGEFFITPLPNGRNAYAQVLGNRRILIKVDKENEVAVVFTDLTSGIKDN